MRLVKKMTGFAAGRKEVPLVSDKMIAPPALSEPRPRGPRPRLELIDA